MTCLRALDFGIGSYQDPFHLDLENPSILSAKKKIARPGKRFDTIEIGKSCDGSIGYISRSPVIVLTDRGLKGAQMLRRRRRLRDPWTHGAIRGKVAVMASRTCSSCVEGKACRQSSNLEDPSRKYL